MPISPSLAGARRCEAAIASASFSISPLLREPLQSHGLVEPAQMHRPFDDFALAGKPQASALSSNGNDAPINIGRILPVDRKLRFAGRTALVERGEIHEREANRSLHLVNIWASEEDGGAMRIYAEDRFGDSVSSRILEELENRLLVFR